MKLRIKILDKWAKEHQNSLVIPVGTLTMGVDGTPVMKDIRPAILEFYAETPLIQADSVTTVIPVEFIEEKGEKSND